MIGRRIIDPLLRRLLRAGLLLACFAGPVHAEQKQVIGAYEAHYSVVPTTFLRPQIAAGYGITRARDRSLVNVTVIDPANGPVTATVSGTVKDLLGQVRTLAFAEVQEGGAVYYLATLRHDDQETLRFRIDVQTPDGVRHEVSFQQKLYWEQR